MSFLEMAEARYSVRDYTDKKVEQEKLKKILEAAHVAPTAANKQPGRCTGRGGTEKDRKGREYLWSTAGYYRLFRPYQSMDASFRSEEDYRYRRYDPDGSYDDGGG